MAIVLYVAAMMLLQFGSSVATSPYSALIPDVVPKAQMGQASGWLALMSLIGIFLLGILLVAFTVIYSVVLSKRIGAMLGLFVIGTVITMLGVKEPPVMSSVEAFKWNEFLAGVNRAVEGSQFSLGVFNAHVC